jgi:hypothetical protein
MVNLLNINIGLQIANHLNWKNHIDQIVPKLVAAVAWSDKFTISAIMTL